MSSFPLSTAASIKISQFMMCHHFCWFSDKYSHAHSCTALPFRSCSCLFFRTPSQWVIFEYGTVNEWPYSLIFSFNACCQFEYVTEMDDTVHINIVRLALAGIAGLQVSPVSVPNLIIWHPDKNRSLPCAAPIKQIQGIGAVYCLFPCYSSNTQTTA